VVVLPLAATAAASAAAPPSVSSNARNTKATILAAPRPGFAPGSDRAAPPSAPPIESGEDDASADAESDDLGALYELAEQAKSARPASVAARCPQCNAEMGSGDVLCANCGYDIRSARALPTNSSAAAAPTPPKLPYATPAASARKSAKAVDMMAPDGSFLAGLAMSAAYALGASVIWFLVAYFTGYSIGYIAALIGVAAGLGMQQGQRGISVLGGWTAVAMTLVAIVVAKLAVLEVLITRINPRASLLNLRSDHVIHYLFTPMGIVIILIGMIAAYRTGAGRR
jgi:hypothetical protein